MPRATEAPRDGPPLATIIPQPEAEQCGAVECERTNRLVTISPDDQKYDRQTVCPHHLVDYLKELNR